MNKSNALCDYMNFTALFFFLLKSKEEHYHSEYKHQDPHYNIHIDIKGFLIHFGICHGYKSEYRN